MRKGIIAKIRPRKGGREKLKLELGGTMTLSKNRKGYGVRKSTVDVGKCHIG